MRVDLNTKMLLNISEMTPNSLSVCSAPPTTPTPTSTSLQPLVNEEEMGKEEGGWRQKIDIITEENKRLHAAIEDVTEINKRWQRYSSERQAYIERLLTTIHEQKKQIDKLTQPRTSECQCNLLESRERLHLEHVKSLELQLEAFQEDWKAERQEKLQLHLEKEALEARVRQLSRQCSQSQAQLREFRLFRMEQVRCCSTASASASASVLPASLLRISGPTTGQLLSRGTTLSLDDDNDQGAGAAAAIPDDDNDNEDEFPSPTSSRASSSLSTELRPELDKWSFASTSTHLQKVKTLKKHASF